MNIRKGTKVRIISDNEIYINWINKDLKVIEATNKGYYYDQALFPEKLCELEDIKTKEVCPYLLYECELERVE